MQPAGMEEEPAAFEEEQLKRMLPAQLLTVSFLHNHLPLYPVPWIIKHTKPEFIFVYIRESRKYVVLRASILYLFFTFLFPLVAAHSLLSYRCAERTYVVDQGTTRTGHGMPNSFKAHTTGCKLQEFMRSPQNNFLLTGPGLFVASTIIGLLLVWGFRKHRKLQSRLMLYVKPFLPRLFYSGLGPAHHDYSAWNVMKEQGVEQYWNWMHDSLGSLDLIVFSIALIFTISFGIIGIGGYLDGLPGVASGAAVAAVVSHAMLIILNLTLGASDKLISFIDGYLKKFNPCKKYIHGKTIDREAVRQEVERASKKVKYSGERTIERRHGGLERQRLDKLVNDINEKGNVVIEQIIMWLLKHQLSMTAVEGACFSLFNATETWCTCEYTIASLALMEVPLLLEAFFDPELKVFRNHIRANGEFASPDFRLSAVYICVPKQLLCTKKLCGTWKWSEVNNEESLAHLAKSELSEPLQIPSYQTRSYQPPKLPEKLRALLC